MKSFQEEDILTQMAPQIFEVNFTSSCLCLPERVRAKLCSHFRDFWLIARLPNKEVNSSMKAGVFVAELERSCSPDNSRLCKERYKGRIIGRVTAKCGLTAKQRSQTRSNTPFVLTVLRKKIICNTTSTVI